MVFIIGLASLPLLLSLILQLAVVRLFPIVVLTVVLLFFLLKNITSLLSAEKNILSWNNGVWTFYNEEINIEGIKSKSSFSLGLMLFLSIRDKNNRRLDLWLFPDSLVDSFCTGFIAHFASDDDNFETKNRVQQQQRGWRHLQGCFHLSDPIGFKV